MPDLLSIRATTERLRADQLPVSENALRHWVKRGEIPCRWSGTKALLFYPSVLQFLQGDTQKDPEAVDHGSIRRISV